MQFTFSTRSHSILLSWRHLAVSVAYAFASTSALARLAPLGALPSVRIELTAGNRSNACTLDGVVSNADKERNNLPHQYLPRRGMPANLTGAVFLWARLASHDYAGPAGVHSVTVSASDHGLVHVQFAAPRCSDSARRCSNHVPAGVQILWGGKGLLAGMEKCWVRVSVYDGKRA